MEITALMLLRTAGRAYEIVNAIAGIADLIIFSVMLAAHHRREFLRASIG
jgi:hypothetical protein